MGADAETASLTSREILWRTKVRYYFFFYFCLNLEFRALYPCKNAKYKNNSPDLCQSGVVAE